jgi:hypothetical protein
MPSSSQRNFDLLDTGLVQADTAYTTMCQSQMHAYTYHLYKLPSSYQHHYNSMLTLLLWLCKFGTARQSCSDGRSLTRRPLSAL